VMYNGNMINVAYACVSSDYKNFAVDALSIFLVALIPSFFLSFLAYLAIKKYRDGGIKLVLKHSFIFSLVLSVGLMLLISLVVTPMC
jgi:hypothetical protein